MTKKTLRDDQTKFIDDMRVALRQTRRIVAKAPTGYGKTLVAASIIEGAQAKNKKVLFTVPLLALIDQTVEAFYKQGITEVGVIQADHALTDWSKPVQVASVDTLISRCTERVEDGEAFARRLNFDKFPQADVVLIDEVHRWFSLYELLITAKQLEKTPIIGLSATPWTKGLGGYFDELVVGGSTHDMIERGLLSPFKVFAPQVHPDMDGVRSTGTVNGRDYVEGEAAERMSRAEIVADVIDTWQKRAEDRPTLCFAVNCAHAKLLQQRFLAAGISADYQDASTRALERAAIKRRFHAGETKVVCNVGTLVVGVDWDIRCISLCRPTRSEMLYVQIIGRGLRTADGKDHLLLLDHSDSTLRLGFVDEIDAAHEGLHNGRADVKNEGEQRIALPKECPACGFIKAPRTALCPNCGTTTASHAPPINEQDGELEELARTRRRHKPLVNGDKAEVFAGLLWISKSRGYNPGWASHKFREIFKVWPNAYKWVQPKRPEDCDLEEWVRREQVKWARNKRRAEHEADQQSNGHATNGHAMTPRQEQIIADVRNEFVPGTLMTKDDLEVDL